jgi:hypothetical protein
MIRFRINLPVVLVTLPAPFTSGNLDESGSFEAPQCTLTVKIGITVTETLSQRKGIDWRSLVTGNDESTFMRFVAVVGAAASKTITAMDDLVSISFKAIKAPETIRIFITISLAKSIGSCAQAIVQISQGLSRHHRSEEGQRYQE